MPNIKPLIIFGSSRSNGDTLRAINTVFQNSEQIPMIDLNQMNISYYDYENKNSDDDFLSIAEKIAIHDPIILATPVYWYTMSAIMKTFIDRWSDVISIRKELGRKFRGKSIYIITAYQVSLPKGFEDPFSQTADYMGMHYKGCYYFNSDDSTIETKQLNLDAATKFRNKILNSNQ